MIPQVRVSRPVPSTANVSPAWMFAVLLLLGGLGFLVATNLYVGGALAAAVVLAAWGGLSAQRPRFALSASLLLLLVAGTKFRTRDPDASLAGLLDSQIAMEIALYALIGLAALVVLATGRARRQRLVGAEWLILAYCGFALISTAWSIAPMFTLVRAAQLTIVAILSIVAARVLTPRTALWLAFTALAAYVFTCAVLAAVFPWASGTYVYTEQNGFRFAWFAVHPIEVATLAALGAIGLLSAIMFAGSPRTAGAVVPFAATALFAVVLLASARGPLLSLMAACVTLLLMKVELRARLAIVSAAVAIAAAVMVIGPDVNGWLTSAANQDNPLSWILFRGQTPDAVLELNGRFGLWEDLAPAMAERFLTGYGYQASRPVVLDAAIWAAYAHNALLQTLLDLGVIGTLALSGIIVGAMFGARVASTPWARATVAAIMVFLVLNSISTESFAGSPGIQTLLPFLCLLAAWAPTALHHIEDEMPRIRL